MHPKGRHALRLARQGFRVFPLQPDDPDMDPAEIKRPALAGDWKKHATTDEAKIEKWWSKRDYNIGVATLPGSDLVVVDYDMKPGQNGESALRVHDSVLEMPTSMRVRTASGGVHVYLRAPAGQTVPNSASKVSKHVDVRGNERGGYVVGPGSTIHGKPYDITDGTPESIEDMPGWLYKSATANRAKTKTHQGEILVELDQPDAISRAIEYLETVAPEAIEGDGGNETTFKTACRVKDLGISEHEALALMSEHWNEHKAIPPWAPDELSTIVHNAYDYGSLPVGVSNPHAEFEPVILDDQNATGRKGNRDNSLHFVDFHEGADSALTRMGEPLIDELLDVGGFSTIYGKSNSGKTFVALDLAFHVAAGIPWHGGRKVRQGLVVYVAAEGGRGIFKRLAALKRHHGIKENIPLAIVPCPVNLMETGKHSDTKKLIDLVRQAEARYGQKCELMVIDTLSRALAGGDENSSSDMGSFVKHVDRIRDEIKTHLAVVHHAGKDIARGARGWSGIQAAIDTEIEIHQNRFTVTKQRDLDFMPAVAFRLTSVQVGERPGDGKPVTSCVVDYLAAPEFEVDLTDHEKEVARAIRRAATAKRKASEDDSDDVILDTAELLDGVAECNSADVTKESVRVSVMRAVKSLVAKNVVQKTQRGQYVVRLVTKM